MRRLQQSVVLAISPGAAATSPASRRVGTDAGSLADSGTSAGALLVSAPSRGGGSSGGSWGCTPHPSPPPIALPIREADDLELERELDRLRVLSDCRLLLPHGVKCRFTPRSAKINIIEIKSLQYCYSDRLML